MKTAVVVSAIIASVLLAAGGGYLLGHHQGFDGGYNTGLDYGKKLTNQEQEQAYSALFQDYNDLSAEYDTLKNQPPQTVTERVYVPQTRTPINCSSWSSSLSGYSNTTCY